MDEILLLDNLVLTNPEVAGAKLRQLSRTPSVTIEDVAGYIADSGDELVYYLDKNGSIKTRDDRDSILAWVDTGLSTRSNTTLFISLYRDHGEFRGYYVSDIDHLVNFVTSKGNADKNFLKGAATLEEKYAKRAATYRLPRLEETLKARTSPFASVLSSIGEFPPAPETAKPVKTVEVLSPTAVTDEISKSLLINMWETKEGLDRYLKISGTRIAQLYASGQSEYYVANSIGSLIVNTGLINKFGKDILVLYRIHKSSAGLPDCYKADFIISKKQDFITNGFTKEDSNRTIKPITFIDADYAPLSASIEDFDVNFDDLAHIIEERRNRFPADIAAMPSNVLASRLSTELETGLKMQLRDSTYAKPSYSGTSGTLYWFLPLHISSDFPEPPDLVLVIVKCGEFYEIKTVYAYDDKVKDRITAMSLYSRLW